MASTSETGHAVNVANLNTMISRLQVFGSRYNPTNNLIKIPNLQNVYIGSSSSIVAAGLSKPPYINSVNARQLLFGDMEKLSSRVLNALDATQNVSDLVVEDAKTIIRKIRGKRKIAKILNPGPEDPIQISASQQSFTQQAEHFADLIALVASVPTYNPNEAELQNGALSTFLAQLKNANLAVLNATTPYLTALQNRNTVIYAPDTGLVDLAQEVKKYVKSVKTITLTEYRKISGLTFTRLKKQK